MQLLYMAQIVFCGMEKGFENWQLRPKKPKQKFTIARIGWKAIGTSTLV